MIRESCNPIIKDEGYVYKYDVTVPIPEYNTLAEEVKHRLSKSPPLATLLPQLKSSALRFLPHIGIGESVNEIISGPNSLTLCSAIIDSTSKSSHELVLHRRM